MEDRCPSPVLSKYASEATPEVSKPVAGASTKETTEEEAPDY
jgi:hypothetical protein